jgi:hypothetical protein
MEVYARRTEEHQNRDLFGRFRVLCGYYRVPDIGLIVVRVVKQLDVSLTPGTAPGDATTRERDCSFHSPTSHHSAHIS